MGAGSSIDGGSGSCPPCPPCNNAASGNSGLRKSASLNSVPLNAGPHNSATLNSVPRNSRSSNSASLNSVPRNPRSSNSGLNRSGTSGVPDAIPRSSVPEVTVAATATKVNGPSKTKAELEMEEFEERKKLNAVGDARRKYQKEREEGSEDFKAKKASHEYEEHLKDKMWEVRQTVDKSIALERKNKEKMYLLQENIKKDNSWFKQKLTPEEIERRRNREQYVKENPNDSITEYIKNEEKPGFFGRMFGKKKANVAEATPVAANVKPEAAAGAKPEAVPEAVPEAKPEATPVAAAAAGGYRRRTHTRRSSKSRKSRKNRRSLRRL